MQTFICTGLSILQNAQSGTDDTKWMTPLKVKQAISYNLSQSVQTQAAKGVVSATLYFRHLNKIAPAWYMYNSSYVFGIGYTKISDSNFYYLVWRYSPSSKTYGIGQISVSSAWNRTDTSVYKSSLYANPDVIPTMYYTNSNNSCALRFVNISSMTASLNYTSSNVYYLPKIIWDINRSFIYAVYMTANTTMVVKKLNWAGTSESNTYTLTVNVGTLNPGDYSISTDSNGGFLVGPGAYTLYYVRPASSIVTSVIDWTPGYNQGSDIKDIFYYNGYFYFLGYNSLSTATYALYRVSPNSSSVSSRSLPSSIINANECSLNVSPNGSFVIYNHGQNTSSTTKSGNFIYGSISSFFSSNSYSSYIPFNQKSYFLIGGDWSRLDGPSVYKSRYYITMDGKLFDLESRTISDLEVGNVFIRNIESQTNGALCAYVPERQGNIDIERHVIIDLTKSEISM